MFSSASRAGRALSQEGKFSPSEPTGQTASYFLSNAECVSAAPILEFSVGTESPPKSPSHRVLEAEFPQHRSCPLVCPRSAEPHEPRGRSPVDLLSRPTAVPLVPYLPRKHFQLLRDSCNHWKHVLKSVISLTITKAIAGFLTTCCFWERKRTIPHNKGCIFSTTLFPLKRVFS